VISTGAATFFATAFLAVAFFTVLFFAVAMEQSSHVSRN
jgi:hypothetical protein